MRLLRETLPRDAMMRRVNNKSSISDDTIIRFFKERDLKRRASNICNYEEITTIEAKQRLSENLIVYTAFIPTGQPNTYKRLLNN
jgi:hypothetical protein